MFQHKKITLLLLSIMVFLLFHLTFRPAAVQANSIAPKQKKSILIDIEQRKLTILIDNQPQKTYPVAVGKSTTPSPIGEWKIIHKGYDWGGGFGCRWLGLNVPWGIYGIHGTNKPWSIGSKASAGCIRMFNKDVLEVFEIVDIGIPVKIIGPPPAAAQSWHHTLKKGHCGPNVVQVQLRLKELGFYAGFCDGLYGQMTELSVRYFQGSNSLPVSGEINQKTYDYLYKDALIKKEIAKTSVLPISTSYT